MSDDRELWIDEQPEPEDDDAGRPDAEYDEEMPDDDYPLLSTHDFDDELEALAAYAGDEPDEADESVENEDMPPDDDFEDDVAADVEDFDQLDDEAYEAEPDSVADTVAGDMDPAEVYAAVSAEQTIMADITRDDADDALALDDEDRLRQPRAGRFRRRLQNQLGMLPLALLLLAVGGYLLARGQDVEGLPDLTDRTLAAISVLTVGVAAVFHALLSGRRERGLLFGGLWILSTAGLIAALVYGLDDDPDIAKWWPLALWSTALALVLTYLLERTHDARLMLLAVVAVVAGTTAYLVSSERIDNDALNSAADYWPLMLTVVGVGLLPLVFQRRAE